MTWSPLEPGADAQPGEVRKVFDRPDGRGRVRGDKHPGFVEEGNIRVAAWGEPRVFIAFDDEDVVLAGAQRGHAGCLLGLFDAQVDTGQGICEVGQRRDQRRTADRQEGADCHRSRHLAGEGTQCLEGLLDVGVDAFSGLGDDRAGGGEDGARCGALDELEADFLLKFLDLLGHCRGRDHEDIGGGNDAAFTRHGQKERQAAGVDIHANSFIK